MSSLPWTENVSLMIIRPRIISNGDSSEYDYEIYLRRNGDHVSEFIIGQQEEWSKIHPMHLCLPRMPVANDHADGVNLQFESLEPEIERKLKNIPMIRMAERCQRDKILSLRHSAIQCLRREISSVRFSPKLFEWWNWLTPITVGGNVRFDTMYYLMFIENDHFDDNEIWMTLDQFEMKYYFQEQIIVPPSDLYELRCLARFRRLTDLQQCLHGDDYRNVPIYRWIPSIQLYQDGSISYLPGDYMYPVEVELMPHHPPRDNGSITMDSMKQKYRKLARNRIEHRGFRCSIVVNLPDQCHYHIPSPMIKHNAKL